VGKKALGKGIEALIPSKNISREKSPVNQSHVIPLDKIRPGTFQPRRNFQATELQELIDSIREKGVLQPILVRKKNDYFEIIAGERRFRASQKLGLLTIPAIEVEASDEETLELALIENLQRTDLSPLEEAHGYNRLQNEFQLTQEQIAQKVGKDRATIANALRLLKLSDSVKKLLESGQISQGHARVLVSLSDEQEQKKFAFKIVNRNLSVRETERLLKNQKPKDGKQIKKISYNNDQHLKQLEKDLRDWLGTKVEIQMNGRKSSMSIAYYNLEDLERILNLFRRGGLR
jgi:ParB family chromosome partitioning protein